LISRTLGNSFPGPVAAWLGPSQSKEPVAALAARFLHGALLRDLDFHRKVERGLLTKIWTPSSTRFRDYDRCIFTLGLAQRSPVEVDVVEMLGGLWLQRAAVCAELSRSVVRNWFVRQVQYDPLGRPYGSRLFARLREDALFGGDVALLVRSDLMARGVWRLVESSAHAVIESVIHAPRVLLAPGVCAG